LRIKIALEAARICQLSVEMSGDQGVFFDFTCNLSQVFTWFCFYLAQDVRTFNEILELAEVAA
jgi:hypothetical protein